MEEEYTPPSSSVAVYPKYDCPHIHTIAVAPTDAANTFLKAKCSDCESSFEPWMCMQCGKCSCSRYVKGHAAAHNSTSGHPISVSFSDFSVWCYSCDSYIVDPEVSDILQALRYVKFELPRHQEEAKGSYFLCNECYQKIEGPRYHCDECLDFDLCEGCHNAGKYVGDHRPEHNCTCLQ